MMMMIIIIIIIIIIMHQDHFLSYKIYIYTLFKE
jgi:hypothetical protein